MRRVLRLSDSIGKASVLFELAKAGWPAQVLAATRVRRINRLTPIPGVLLVNQRSYRNLGKIGITQKLSAIEERAAEGFQCQMYCPGRSAIFGQIVAFQNIENLDQRNSAGGRGWRADDFIATIRAAHGFALFHFIMRQIIGGE